jgi:hypothetical protein
VPQFRDSRKYVHVLLRGEDGEWRFAVLISNNSQLHAKHAVSVSAHGSTKRQIEAEAAGRGK